MPVEIGSKKTSSEQINFDQLESTNNYSSSRRMVEGAEEALALIEPETRDELKILLDQFVAYKDRLSENAFCAGVTPLRTVSTSLDRLFERVAGNAVFKVEGVVNPHEYPVIRDTALAGHSRLAKLDPSMEANLGDHISSARPSRTGIEMQRSSDHYSRYQAALITIREELVDALSIALDKT